jgi:hypothetical protein
MNNKKYKNKITGDIAELKSNVGYSLNRHTIGLIPIEYIENSNDWEEIVEKPENYEILSFKKKSNGTITTKRSNGLFLNIKQQGNGEFPEKRDLDIWDIHSIKRKSDNEIFTIEDKLTEGTILKFKLSNYNDGIYADTRRIDGDDIYDYIGLPLDKWIKLKESLFITEDDKKIFEGDLYYFVWIKNDITPLPKNHQLFEIYEAISEKLKSNQSWAINAAKFFSTQETAEEYIFLNKPILSLNDVASIYPGINKTHNSPSHQAEQLKQLVRNKLKL